MPTQGKRLLSKRIRSSRAKHIMAGVAVLGLIAALAGIYHWERRRLLQLAYQRRLVTLTFPEGFNRFEIAERLEHYGVCSSKDFLMATADPQVLRQLSIHAPSAEGYLFPDTYQFLKGTHPSAIVQKFVNTWKTRLNPVFHEHQTSLHQLKQAFGWQMHEIIILASIVEKEASLNEERPMIAGVFLNRIRSKNFNPKLLQADPTLAYGCQVAPEMAPSCEFFDGTNLGKTQRLDKQNPYNTYHFEGLPPGPITNPGLDAILAVLQPSQHDYYYFVAKGNGSHYFSHSLQEHQSAINRYLKALKPPSANAVPGER